MNQNLPKREASLEDQFKGGQIPSLNGWRAIAITIVIAGHFVLTKNFPRERFPIWTFFSFDQAKLGVRIFFVLSGFLITYLLLKEGDIKTNVSLTRFYLRRCLRILPVYFLYLFVLGLLTVLGWYHDSLSSWIGVLTFSRNIIGSGESCTAHFWSLAIEEQFYLAWPIIIAILMLWKRWHLACILLLLPILFCPMERMAAFNIETNGPVAGRVFGGWSIFAFADSLAVGCLGAFWIRRIPFRLNRLQASVGIFVSLTIVVSGAVWNYFGGFGGTAVGALIPTIQAFAIMFAIWISIFYVDSIVYRFLNWPPVNWLGVLSYSLYIWQHLFTSVNAGTKLSMLFFYDWHIWWVAALFAAVLSYYCIERPALRFKDKVSS